ncbi:MAG: uracil-DNA glycosylase [Chloroflexi bacterium]|nr:uracil-DNA glycosylase [Chloroflexota bacterium]
MTETLSLAEIAEAIRSCTRCPLHQTRRNPVPGEGPEDARVMLVGEAPGYYEDRSGRPFVGAAGRVLDELLALAGLRRDQVFITNIIKCRPPKNRDPKPEELQACQPYLRQQILAIDPDVIVTLGRFSMQYFLPGAKISQVHGRPFRRGKRWIVPMYHPAVALYRPPLRAVMEEDYRALGKALREWGILPDDAPDSEAASQEGD